MNLTDISETSLISYIKERCKGSGKEITIDIGDDAASILIGTKNLLATTDLMTEGIHFDLAYSTPYQVGFKLVSVNVSDIYAMYGDPSYMLLTMALPPHITNPTITNFFDGLIHSLTTYNVKLIGGDISSSKSGIMLSATLLGFAEKPVPRSGATPGDNIYVTGYLGDSACGLELLKKINKPVALEKGETIKNPLEWNIMKPLISRHLMPEVKKPNIGSARINSMMDMSDGLSIDLKRLCMESRAGATVYLDKLPLSQEMRQASQVLQADQIKLSLCGGEDYQYLFTSPDQVEGAICIGEITENKLIIIDEDQKEIAWRECGYEHFTRDQ